MPTNLNALIRFKTIDSCLHGGKRCSIQDLIEKCSSALSEYRGKDDPVSERTIRGDLHFMRSDLFNAPIEVKDGYYYYSEPHFSIFNLRIDNAVAFDIISKSKRNHIDKLPVKKITAEENISDIRFLLSESDSGSELMDVSADLPFTRGNKRTVKDTELTNSSIIKQLTWGEVFEIVLNKA